MNRLAESELGGGPLPASPHRTLTDALVRAAGAGREVILLDASEQERVEPWSAVLTRARRLSVALRGLGVRPGERVALVLPTGAPFLDAFFGVQLAGAVPVPLYPPVRLGRLAEYHALTARLLRASGARLVVADPAAVALLGESIARARPALGIHTPDALARMTGLAAASAGEATGPGRSGSASPPEAAGDDPEALALVQFSSGSTREPKPVALTHANVLAQCEVLRAAMPLPEGAEHVGVSWLPLYHDMGLIGCLLSAVTFPGKLVLLPPELFLARPAAWLRALSRHRATVSPAPNFAYALCAQRVRDEELTGADLSSWRYALCGAEPVAPRVLERFAERFERFGLEREALLPVYGLAEASLAVTFGRPDGTKRARSPDGGDEVVSVGRVVAGHTLALRDPEGRPTPAGQVGRVFVKGPSVMKGYLERPEETAKALVDGWLDTGDLGFIEGGELFVTGRAKDVIVIRGENHAPQRFEEAVDAVDGVRTGCAVAVGHVTEAGEGLVLFVEARSPKAPPSDSTLATAVLAATGVRPRKIVVLAPGTLPRTSSGKLRRAETASRWRAGTLEAPSPVSLKTLAGAVLKSAVAMARSRSVSG